MMSRKMLAVAVAVIGLAFMPLQAEQMKCGAGKCGATTEKGANTVACPCNVKDCDHENCAHMKDPSKPCDCNATKPAKIKCGANASGKSMKCGAGKCGGN